MPENNVVAPSQGWQEENLLAREYYRTGKLPLETTKN